MKKTVTVTSNSERVILLETSSSKYRVTVPEDAKFTFGPAVPYIGKKDYSAYSADSKGYALRIYRGSKENLVAVFSGVKWFRDLSLKVEKEEVSKSGQSSWSEDESGHRRSENVDIKRAFKEEK